MVPLLKLPEVIVSTVTYVSVWQTIQLRVKQHGTFKHASAVIHVYSYVQVVVSSILLTLTLLSLVSPPQHAPSTTTFTTILHAVHKDDSFLPRYCLHLSRIFEYLDMVFFVAAGNTPDLHFAFHHLTTPYLTYFRTLHDYEGWQVFAALNGFHHVLMHLFFAGVTGWTRPVLPWTRYIQLIMGIGWDVWIVRGKLGKGEGGVRGYGVEAVLLSCYFVLLTREIRMSRRAESLNKSGKVE